MQRVMGTLPFSPYILIAALVSILLFVFTTDASEIVEKPFRFPILGEEGYETAATSAGAEPTIEDLGHFAGYVTLSGNTNKRCERTVIFDSARHIRLEIVRFEILLGVQSIFYYRIQSKTKNKNGPLMLFLNGGSGVSGSVAMYYGIGPYLLNNASTLVNNEFGWDSVADLLILDQPSGTGFSIPTKDDDIPTTTEKAVIDLYDFLKTFFQKHAELANNELFLAGQGYAGHFLPSLATRIVQGNEKNEFQIKLKSILIGNPWMNGAVQFASYPAYAREMKLISSAQYTQTMKDAFSGCQRQAQKACNGPKRDLKACTEVNAGCNDILWESIITPAGKINYYDIDLKSCVGSLCYDFSILENFLNQASVKEALGVEPNAKFVTWSARVNNSMAGDVMRDLTHVIPALLERGIKIVVYAGINDFIVNPTGIWDVISGIKWSGQGSFSPYRSLKVDGVKDAGKLRSSGPLTFVVVNNAGHVVPMSQPAVALAIVNRLTKGIPI
ncbi:hypothetical protein OROGR_022076 [Orobanche gracilis]